MNHVGTCYPNRISGWLETTYYNNCTVPEFIVDSQPWHTPYSSNLNSNNYFVSYYDLIIQVYFVCKNTITQN